jgi:Flp pilus assembly CpaE family ATPase
MPGIAVSFLTEEKDRSVVLQNRLDSAQVSRTVFSHNAFPITPTDPVLRQIQDVRSEVVFIDIDPAHPHRAISAIELIHATTAEIVIFAIGEMTNPATIVSVMRAGAREYLDRNASTEAIAEAFARYTTARNKARASSGRARIFTITNAKGGAGATTVAVNTAIALQEMKGNVLLVDFAPLGHTALHLNVRPTFGLPDALQNLHRMDVSLLEGLMTECKGGLRLLAGSQQPFYGMPAAAELARLFDLLVTHFQYVIVDCSNRVDHTARMLCDLSSAVLVVAQTDVVSLWSAGRMRTFLEEGGTEKVRLVLNRYKKIPGFTDDDVEKATDTKLLWKIPNNFQAIAPAIDKGTPVAFNDSQEIGRSYRALAATLAGAASNADGGINLTPQTSKTPGRFLSPLRAER